MKTQFSVYSLLLIMFLVSLAGSFNAHASLLIAPTRVVFDERTRTAKVYLINNSNERKTYRLGWKETLAKPEGGYETLSGLIDSSLSPMVRMSPSQLTLSPGERQVVKLAIRKPKGLKQQEYRSHLQFKALPNQKEHSKKQVGINISMIMSYSIPVMYRPKKQPPVVDITSVEIKQPNTLIINLNKKGQYSSFGNYEAWFIPENGNEEKQIAVLSHASIYAETNEAVVELSTIDGFKFNQNGTIKVTYIGEQEYRGHTFAQQTIPFKL